MHLSRVRRRPDYPERCETSANHPFWPHPRIKTQPLLQSSPTICCRKSEIGVSLPHEQSCPAAWPRPRVPIPAPLNARGKSARKNFPRLNPRNPLKSLDSHERIQGNPRQSNPPGAGLQRETARSQENPNGSTGPMSRARCRDGAKPTPSEGKAPRAWSLLLTRRAPRVRRSQRSPGSARGSARRSASARPRDRAEPDDRRRGSAGDSRPRPPTAR